MSLIVNISRNNFNFPNLIERKLNINISRYMIK